MYIQRRHISNTHTCIHVRTHIARYFVHSKFGLLCGKVTRARGKEAPLRLTSSFLSLSKKFQCSQRMLWPQFVSSRMCVAYCTLVYRDFSARIKIVEIVFPHQTGYIYIYACFDLMLLLQK